MHSHTISRLLMLTAVVAAGCGVETKRDSKVEISSISPDTSSITGGVEIQIGGSGFDDGNAPTVTFGPNEAVVTDFSDSSLSVILPAGLGCGPVDLQVNNSNGFAFEDHGFTYTGGNGALSITSITPGTGDIQGDTEVIITGTGFTGGVGITLGGRLLRNIEVLSDNEIRARTPDQLTGGIMDLQLRNCADEATLPSAYLYLSNLNGVLVEVPFFDYIRPGQFAPGAQDFIDPFVAFVAPTAESLLNPLPPTLDTCAFNAPDSPAVSFDILGAGEQVSLASGAQSMALGVQPDDLYYYPQNDPASTQVSKFVSNGSYGISGPGNATLPAFSTANAFTVPADFAITAPSFASDTPATITANAQLQWSWNASTPGDHFQIVLVGYDNAGAATNEVLDCFVRDDGGFLIPANEISKFDDATQLVTYAIRRKDTSFVLPANGSNGVAVGMIYKMGVLYFP